MKGKMDCAGVSVVSESWGDMVKGYKISVSQEEQV